MSDPDHSNPFDDDTTQASSSTVWAGLKCVHYPFVLKDIPRFAAITLVAPGVRFSALAIFLTPCLSLAIDFNVRKSSLVHARRTTFFFFAISVPFLRTGLLSWRVQ
jgi:hypothetical protein